MPSIEERLEAVAQSVELVMHSQEQLAKNITHLENVVNVLGESQAASHAASQKRLDKIERIMSRLATMTIDHE